MNPNYLLTMLRKTGHVCLTDNIMDRIFDAPKHEDIIRGLTLFLTGKPQVKLQREIIDEWCNENNVRYWYTNTAGYMTEHHFKLLK
jgi:hypothetical protein